MSGRDRRNLTRVLKEHMPGKIRRIQEVVVSIPDSKGPGGRRPVVLVWFVRADVGRIFSIEPPWRTAASWRAAPRQPTQPTALAATSYEAMSAIRAVDLLHGDSFGTGDQRRYLGSLSGFGHPIASWLRCRARIRSPAGQRSLGCPILNWMWSSLKTSFSSACNGQGPQ
jgi:hypothetical protein